MRGESSHLGSEVMWSGVTGMAGLRRDSTAKKYPDIAMVSGCRNRIFVWAQLRRNHLVSLGPGRANRCKHLRTE
jgi:hypothetical protein